MRIGNLKRAWGNLLKEADLPQIQIKDLRSFFNWVLVSHYGFGHKEAGAYLGNIEVVNYLHYTPVSPQNIRSKLQKRPALMPQIGI